MAGIMLRNRSWRCYVVSYRCIVYGRMKQVPRAFRLRWEERSFLEDVMNQAIAKVQKKI